MTTKDIFNNYYSQMIDHALRGFNVTIFAYGQTSTGKTHTMHGTTLDVGLIPMAAT